MATFTTTTSIIYFLTQNPIIKTQPHNFLPLSMPIPKPKQTSLSNLSFPSPLSYTFNHLTPFRTPTNTRFSCNCTSTASTNTNYEFYDGSSEVELRLPLGGLDIQSSRDILVDAEGTSLTVRVQRPGSSVTLLETNHLFEKIKPAETIWFIDEDQLVVNLKKWDQDFKWPDIVETWKSLTAGSMQLLKGTSIYVVGDSTEINRKVARELAVGLGYTPLDTQELLETFANQTIESWILAEGPESISEAESAILESLSSHVRAVVSTMGGKEGAARRTDRWRHIYAGFSLWLSQTEATDEDSAKEEAKEHVQDGSLGFYNADVVVKLQGWDGDYAKSVAQASLSALKQLVLSDKELPGWDVVGIGPTSNLQGGILRKK